MLRISKYRHAQRSSSSHRGLFGWLLLTTFVTTGCGGSSNAGSGDNDAITTGTVGLSNCPALAGSGDISTIAGLYDASEVDGTGTDVFYVQITTSGSVIGYDYQQDDVDSSDNCYLIGSGESAYRATGNSTFTNVQHVDADINCEIRLVEDILITRSNSMLTIEGPDFDDDDGDGDTTERVVSAFPVLTGLSTSDFNVCL